MQEPAQLLNPSHLKIFCSTVLHICDQGSQQHILWKKFSLGTFLQLSRYFSASDSQLLCKCLSMCPVDVLAVSHPAGMFIFFSMQLCLMQGREFKWKWNGVKSELYKKVTYSYRMLTLFMNFTASDHLGIVPYSNIDICLN